MRSLAIFFGVLAAAFFGVKIWWHITYPTATWRYKMTVNVETPEGIKTGSAVREIYAYPYFSMEGYMNVGTRLRGEAVAVDLGKRGVLFALMRGADSDYATDVMLDAFPYDEKRFTQKNIRHYASLPVGTRVALKSGQYPFLVRFHDLKDSKTMESLYEMEIYDARNKKGDYLGRDTRVKTDRMEEILGAGVKIAEVSLEITDEPVTWGIKKILPSFGKDTGFREWASHLTYPDLRGEFGLYDFQRGDAQ